MVGGSSSVLDECKGMTGMNSAFVMLVVCRWRFSCCRPVACGGGATLTGLSVGYADSCECALLQGGAIGGVPCAVYALCTRCAKSWPFSTAGSLVSSEDWKDVIEWLLQWTGL